jgi:mRNA interferase MazF
MRYEPNEGDLVWTDFDPRTGREQGGRRPALILSPIAFWQAFRFVIVCPITPKVRPFPTSVLLPAGGIVTGEILPHHTRSIDTQARPIIFTTETVPAETLTEVRMKLAALIGLNNEQAFS